MAENNRIIIISPDFLQGYGLRAILQEYFAFEQVDVITNLNEIDNLDTNCRLLFIHTSAYVVLHDKIASLKNKVVVLVENELMSTLSNVSFLNITQQPTLLIDNIGVIIEKKTAKDNLNKNELSDREREVLALIAKGAMNKTIADELNISMNTVFTHRKNITAKLGIKTISGLTVYAILNGVISAEEVPL